MYRVTIADLYNGGEKEIFAVGSQSMPALSIKINERVNDYGTMTVVLPKTTNLTTSATNQILTLYDKDENVLWQGMVVNESSDMFGNRRLTAYGMLYILTFQLLPNQYWTYPSTMGNVLSWMLTENNLDRGSGLAINTLYDFVNTFDGTLALDPVYDFLTEGASTYESIKKLCEPYYYFYPTYYAPFDPYRPGRVGVNIGAYSQANKKVNQPIGLGLNLLDYTNENSMANYKTACAPVGKDANGDPVFITSVTQDGSGYVKLAQSIIDNYGERRIRVNFDNISDPNELMTAGQNWLTNNAFQELTLTLKAVDLARVTKSSFDEFKLGYFVDVDISEFGVRTTLPILERSIDVLKPANSSLTISNTYQIPLSEIVRNK